MPALSATELILTAVLLGQLRPGDLPEVRIRSGPYAFPQSVISVEANLVSTAVTVRDRRGIPMSGLTKADFEIFDEGKPQEIKFFTTLNLTRPIPASPQFDSAGQPQTRVSTRPPRSLALFFDDTHAAIFDAHKSALAAEKVVDEAGPLDRIALFTGSGRVFVDFTTDREKLRAALKKIIPHWSRRQLDPCITLDPYQAYVVAKNLDAAEVNAAVAKAVACNCPPPPDKGCVAAQVGVAHDTAEVAWDLYKAGSEDVLDILRIAVNRLAQMPENRILVMLSRGFVTGGMYRRKSEIVNAALHAHIVISALDPEGLLPHANPLRQMVLQELMQEVSGATGGRFIKNNNDITGGLDALVTLPDVSYTLGFVPMHDPDGKYHSLKVRLKNNHGYEILARQGYWSDKPDPVKEPAQRRIDEVVLSSKEIAEIPTSLRISVPAPDSGEPLAVKFKVDPRPLRFVSKDGRSMQELTFVAVLMNAAGEYLTGKQVVMDLALTSAKLASMQESGIEGVMNFPVAPGNYSIRAVVREAGQNRIAASSASFAVK